MLRLVYNAVAIESARSASLSAEEARGPLGEDTGLQRVRLEVTGTVRPPAGMTLQDVRAALMAPRRPIALAMAGHEFLASPQNPALLDEETGPHPRSLQVETVIGDRAVLVRWGCTLTMPQVEPWVRSYAWQLTHGEHIDGHEITGRASLDRRPWRTAGGCDPGLPQLTLMILAPPCPRGMTREVLELTTAGDCTGLAFRLRDRPS